MCGGLAPVGGNCEDRHASKEGRREERGEVPRERIDQQDYSCIIYRTGLWEEGKGERCQLLTSSSCRRGRWCLPSHAGGK